MSEKIVDRNLSRIVKVKMCVNNLKTIEEIEDISIQNINLMQNKLDINLIEITKLKNLKSISLKFFDISDEVIETINKLEHIKKIEFLMCSFTTKKVLSKKIKSVIIYNCKDFDINILNEDKELEELQLIHSGIVDISNLIMFSNLKYLKLSDCNVISIPKISLLDNLEELYLNNIEILYNIDISNLLYLKFVSLNGSKVPNKQQYIEELQKQNGKLKIEYREDNLPIE